MASFSTHPIRVCEAESGAPFRVISPRYQLGGTTTLAVVEGVREEIFDQTVRLPRIANRRDDFLQNINQTLATEKGTHGSRCVSRSIIPQRTPSQVISSA